MNLNPGLTLNCRDTIRPVYLAFFHRPNIVLQEYVLDW